VSVGAAVRRRMWWGGYGCFEPRAEGTTGVRKHTLDSTSCVLLGSFLGCRTDCCQLLEEKTYILSIFSG
jgi:hypothetical protein